MPRMPFARASLAASRPSIERGTLSGSECTWMSIVPRSTSIAWAAGAGVWPVGVATRIAAASMAAHISALAVGPHGTPTRLPRWGPRHAHRELTLTPRLGFTVLGSAWPQALYSLSWLALRYILHT